MERTEYTEKMGSLCRQQTDLKISYTEYIEDIEVEAQKQVAAINEKARLEKREKKNEYRRKQLELELMKQQLRTEYLAEHPAENNRS